MIYRNSPSIDLVVWTPEENPEAVAIARRFLHGERELLRLVRAETRVINDLQQFLDLTAELPAKVFRSVGGNILLYARKADESLMMTGKTAEVLGSYIDRKPVLTEDRVDMTLRRDVDESRA